MTESVTLQTKFPVESCFASESEREIMAEKLSNSVNEVAKEACPASPPTCPGRWVETPPQLFSASSQIKKHKGEQKVKRYQCFILSLKED